MKGRLMMESRVMRRVFEALAVAAFGFVLSGATLFSRPLPPAACLVAAFPMGAEAILATVGAVSGYFLRCEVAFAAEYAAQAMLMLAAVCVFQGTTLLSAEWFMPTVAASVSAIFGGLCLLGGGLQWSLFVTKILLSAVATAAFRRALRQNRTILWSAALVSGLAGTGWAVDPAIVAACCLCCKAASVQTAAVLGLTLALSGGYGLSALPALLVPTMALSQIRSERRELSAPLFCVLSLATSLCFGELTVGRAVSVLVGSVGGALLLRFLPVPLRAPQTAEASDRLLQAAETLELLRDFMPREELTLPCNEAEDVYDAAAERVCRCCPRFHRCWEQNAAVTYEALSAAAHPIIARGTAKAEDFSEAFRDNCCHMEGFLVALNQELEGTLYRRRYRMQLRESRQVIARQLETMAQYLRARRDHSVRRKHRFAPQVGVSAMGRHGSRFNGDTGAYFMGEDAKFYVLLCDGMGTGAAAQAESGDTVRLLQRLLQGGFSPESALRLLNGAELLRGTSRFSTVDLLQVNLCDGAATLYKWGAAPSYLRSGERVTAVGAASPPPGFSPNCEAARYPLDLKNGQILTMATDGADPAQLSEAMDAYDGDSPRELAALLIATAQGDDDMTVVTVSLHEKSPP